MYSGFLLSGAEKSSAGSAAAQGAVVLDPLARAPWQKASAARLVVAIPDTQQGDKKYKKLPDDFADKRLVALVVR